MVPKPTEKEKHTAMEMVLAVTVKVETGSPSAKGYCHAYARREGKAEKLWLMQQARYLEVVQIMITEQT